MTLSFYIYFVLLFTVYPRAFYPCKMRCVASIPRRNYNIILCERDYSPFLDKFRHLIFSRMRDVSIYSTIYSFNEESKKLITCSPIYISLAKEIFEIVKMNTENRTSEQVTYENINKKWPPGINRFSVSLSILLFPRSEHPLPVMAAIEFLTKAH